MSRLKYRFIILWYWVFSNNQHTSPDDGTYAATQASLPTQFHDIDVAKDKSTC